MRPSQIIPVTATGAVSSGRNCYLRDVVLTAAAEAASIELRAGDGSGAALLTVSAAIGTTEAVSVCDAVFAGGIHATITGAAATASVVFA